MNAANNSRLSEICEWNTAGTIRLYQPNVGGVIGRLSIAAVECSVGRICNIRWMDNGLDWNTATGILEGISSSRTRIPAPAVNQKQ